MKSIKIAHNNETLTMTEWSKKTNIPIYTIYKRLKKGLSTDEIFKFSIKHTNFSRSEDIFIRLAFIEFGAKEISKYMGRSMASIENRARRLGVKFFGEVFYIGQRFGKLIIKKRISYSNRQKKYLCECDCGILKEVLHERLKSKNTKSCGCLKRECGSKKVGEIAGIFYTRYKLAAKNKGKEFTITKEYLSDLFEKQERKCALTGLPINIVWGNDSRGCTASIDRINSNLGYIEGNVQFVHIDVNRMKLHHPQDYFINLCKLIVDKANKEKKGEFESEFENLRSEHEQLFEYRPTIKPKRSKLCMC